MLKEKKYLNQEGAAMVISVLILSVVMLSLAIMSSTSFIREIQIIETIKSKKIASSAATACLELALDRLGRNANYQGNEDIDLGQSSCAIMFIGAGPPWVIESEAIHHQQYAKFRIILSSRTPVVIESWEEVSF